MDADAVFGIWKRLRPSQRRFAVELAFLTAVGLLMGVLGPFESDAIPSVARYPYWLACLVGGGLIGLAIEASVKGWRLPPWGRVLVISAFMTPPITLWVLAIDVFGFGVIVRSEVLGHLVGQVFAISLPLTAVRALVWRAPRVETRTIVEPPSPEAEAAFRGRLSAKRRAARLIAVEAEDHYLRVHTDAGAELLLLRFADALEELARAHGYRVHRSWWVAASAIEGASWRRGSGEVRLAGGLTAPVSRTYAPMLKKAGWLK
jgi:hypothetical protein